MDWFRLLLEALFTLARRTPSPDEFYTWLEKYEGIYEYVPYHHIAMKWGPQMAEQGAALCERPQYRDQVVAHAHGRYTFTESPKESCRRAGGYATAYGHLHPASAVIPSFGDIEDYNAELLGLRAFCIARNRRDGRARALCVETTPEGFDQDEILALQDIREEVENAGRMSEVRYTEAEMRVEFGAIPYYDEDDVEGDEELFCRIVNADTHMRCRIHDEERF